MGKLVFLDDLKKPSIADLQVQKYYTKVYDAEKRIDEYVNNVIIPSHDYFNLKKEIESKISSSQSNALGSLFFAFIVALCRFSLFFKSLDLSEALCIFLVIICSIALLALSFLLSKIIYDHTDGKISDCYFNIQLLEKRYGRTPTDWEIIREHKSYLESIKTPIFHRNTGSVIMATLTFMLQAILWGNFN